MKRSTRRLTGLLLSAAIPTALAAEGTVTNSLNMFGLPSGLIDMPTAEVAPDAQLSTTISHFGGITKTSLTFQLTPRITGTFRYAGTRNFRPFPTYPLSTYYDRSFDVRLRLLDETKWRPAISLGLRDMIGTGLYGGEYIVATKSIGEKVRVTGGVGWGRLGSYGTVTQFGTRPVALRGSGGIPTYDRWFRGDVAPFAGISYQHSDKLAFSLEYSSDAYPQEDASGVFQHRTPVNIGMQYRVSDSMRLGAYYMYGSELGVNINFILNARKSTINGGLDTAPQPVGVRTARTARDLGWTVDPQNNFRVEQSIAKLLVSDGIILEALQLDGTSAEALIRNDRYDIPAQAVGRTMRALSRTLPASVETIKVTQSSNGVPLGSVTLSRSDIEALEFQPADQILQAATFSDSSRLSDFTQRTQDYPRVIWSFGPGLKLSVFDPDSPVRADLRAAAAADIYIGPGWVISGAAHYKLGGNLNGLSPSQTGIRYNGPNPPHKVRSDARNYAAGNGPKIDHLTIAKNGRLGENLHGRVTAGYLEQMYAGVSGEILWKKPSSRFALGAELNYVVQRDFDQQFGLQDYKIATGHVSAYYDLGKGFHTQLDVGRYLAGDWGATISLDREFANGWRVGAYATFTDLGFDRFGEGSFDKGIHITIPLATALGNATKRASNITLQSLTRDGGARVNVNGRLYDTVRETHGSEMAKSWGKFWR